MPQLDPERKAALHAARLSALIKSARPEVDAWQQVPYGPGAAFLEPEVGPGQAPVAWISPAEAGLRSLSEALLWSTRHRVGDLHLVVHGDDELTGHLARRAGLITEPPITVWSATTGGDTPELRRAVPVEMPAAADPLPAPTLVDLLLDAGVEVIIEGGVVRGEVNGLEVARVVHGETSWGVPVEGPVLEVGVGGADRELTGHMHAELDVEQRLARAVELVRRHRSPDAAPHPLNQLVPERWLRAVVVSDPGMVHLDEARPAQAWPPRPNLVDRSIALGRGTTREGRPVVLAFSVGMDVDLVPAAADARASLSPDADLWLVVPERDDVGWLRELAQRIDRPASVVPVPNGWRR